LLHKYLYTSIATKIYRTDKEGKSVPNFHEDEDDLEQSGGTKLNKKNRRGISSEKKSGRNSKSPSKDSSTRKLKGTVRYAEDDGTSREASYKKDDENNSSSVLTSLHLDNLFKVLANRVRFTITWRDFFMYMAKLLCIRKVYSGDSKKNLLIQRATKLVEYDLSVIQIIKHLKRSHHMFNVLFRHHKKFMFYYQRDLLIHPEDAFKDAENDGISSQDSEDLDYEEIGREVKNYG